MTHQGRKGTAKKAAKQSMPAGFPQVDARQRRAKRRLLQQTVRQCDLEQTHTIADLVDAFGGMSIQARSLGACLEVLTQIYADAKRPTVMLGLAGPLIAAPISSVPRTSRMINASCCANLTLANPMVTIVS